MKDLGKIIEFDGNTGWIINKEGIKYLVLPQNIQYENPQNGDFVTFVKEVYKTIEIEENIATFIRKTNN